MLPDEQQERVRSSFAKQGLMTTLGATLTTVSPGMVEITLLRIQRFRNSTASFTVELSAPSPTARLDMLR